MRQTEETPFERYLRRVNKELADVEPARREALLAELRAHLDDAAEAEGRAADNSQLQERLIARLGPARSVGRELARANGAPRESWQRFWLWLGGVGVLLAPLIVLGAFTIPDEDLAEFVLICALLPATLAVPAVHALCRRIAPIFSTVTWLVGSVTLLMIPVALLINLLAPTWAHNTATQRWLGTLWICAPGIWAIMAGMLLLRSFAADRERYRGHELLALPALLGIGWGCAWLIPATNITEGDRWASPSLLSMAFLVWLLLGLLWSLTMSIALIQAARRGAGAAPAAGS